MHEIRADAESHLNCPRCYAVFRNRYPACPLDGTPLVDMAEDLLVGKLIADRYLIEQFVGEGGMGRVYRARHKQLSRRFAIKVLFGEFAAEDKARARFAREAEAASRLDHPNVVSVTDYGETPTRLPYLAMDFVEGKDLLTVLEIERRLPLDRVLRLGKDMCRGLAHAHSRGLVHRDFKPGNVMIVDDHGREVPRIADFGLAIDPDDLSPRLTTGRIIFGSPAYMSPEQASNGAIDARADQFALGVTLFELLTGRLPFGGSAVEQLTQNASAPRPLMTVHVPDLVVPESVEQLVQKLMAIWPEARFPNVDATLAEIEAIEAEMASINARASAANARSATGRKPRTTRPTGPTGPMTPMTTTAAMAAAAIAAAAAGRAQNGRTDLVPTLPSGPEPGPNGRRLLLVVGAILLVGVSVGVLVGLSGRGAKPPPIVFTAVTIDAGPTVVGPGRTEVADAAPMVAALAPDGAPEVVGPHAGNGKRPKLRPDAGIAATIMDPPVVIEKDPPVVIEKDPPVVIMDPPVVIMDPPIEKPPVVEPPGALTPKSITDYYTKVGTALEQLSQKKGKDAAEPFRKRYFAIPLNDALRTPGLRADTMKKLGALERDIRTALASP